MRVTTLSAWLVLSLLVGACAGQEGEAAQTGDTLLPQSTAETVSSTTNLASNGVDPATLELMQAYLGCMEERGFIGEIRGGSTEFYVEPEEQAVFDAAQVFCDEKMIDLGLLEFDTTPPTDDELAARRAFLIETAACLEDLGFPISDPPSEEAFIDDGGESWIPHGELPRTLREEAWLRANDLCPQA